jgi:hypothetical protein
MSYPSSEAEARATALGRICLPGASRATRRNAWRKAACLAEWRYAPHTRDRTTGQHRHFSLSPARAA